MGRASHNCQHAAAISQLHRSADPGQPQRVWCQFHLGQSLNLDADDVERSTRRAANMEVTPGVDMDLSIEWVIELDRLPRLAVCALIGETKRRAVQARSSTAGALPRREIHDAVLDQAPRRVSPSGEAPRPW